MQPTLCSKCKKNVAVVFISRQNEKGEMVNEGLCLKCAAQLGLPQVEEMMKKMGISPEDLENINNEMMQAFGGAEEMNDLPDGEGEDDEESGKTATFPFLNRLFNNGSNPPAEQPRENGGNAGAQPTGRKKEQKRGVKSTTIKVTDEKTGTTVEKNISASEMNKRRLEYARQLDAERYKDERTVPLSELNKKEEE